MNDQPKTPKMPISDVYVNDFNRIARSLESRCQITGDIPSMGEMESQIALRGSIMKIASFRRELTSVRAMITRFIEDECWPEGTVDLEWLTSADMESVGQLHSAFRRTGREFADLGQEISGQLVNQVMELNYPGSEEDAARALSGLSPERSQRKKRDKKFMSIITDKEFMELELFLSDHPHKNALTTLSNKRTDGKALLRIFMRTIRLTGMRPIELFKCRILVGDTAREYSDHVISEIRKAPYQAAIAGLLTPLDQIPIDDGATLSAVVRKISETTGVPIILYIETAKTTNSNPKLKRPFRAQILDGISEDDLQVLCLAAHLNIFRMDQKKCSNHITAMTRNLSQIAAEVLPKRSDSMNLYSFRHDFATRARIAMPVWEVAALMGHTAKASTYAYGKRNTRKKSGSGSDGWMPSPDEEFAETIREKWGIAANTVAQVDSRQALNAALGLEAPAENPAPAGPGR